MCQALWNVGEGGDRKEWHFDVDLREWWYGQKTGGGTGLMSQMDICEFQYASAVG